MLLILLYSWKHSKRDWCQPLRSDQIPFSPGWSSFLDCPFQVGDLERGLRWVSQTLSFEFIVSVRWRRYTELRDWRFASFEAFFVLIGHLMLLEGCGFRTANDVCTYLDFECSCMLCSATHCAISLHELHVTNYQFTGITLMMNSSLSAAIAIQGFLDDVCRQ